MDLFDGIYLQYRERGEREGQVFVMESGGYLGDGVNGAGEISGGQLEEED